ncbi:MAG: type II toxin-antitoxin system RelE/ParE family toxin [Candidatus Aminicenantes bacterium]|nr:type II toxin-antitoxin system RelE/ParE family toxin [Candidatus Aminicenantes bacterium]
MKPPAHRILYTREAKRNIDSLDTSVRKLVRRAVESLAAEPEKGKPLSHQLAGLRSLRTSDYRIIYRAKGSDLVVLVVAVGHRREVYKRLGELIGLAARKK